MSSWLPVSASINFLWPMLLWLLVILPFAVWIHVRLGARRNSGSVRYAGLSNAPRADGLGARRHLPAFLMLAGLALLVVAIARPHASLVLPTRLDTIILAMDISGSMRAADVKPSRLKAAQDAAKTFIADQPGGVKIGVIAVAGAAALVQQPTRNREDIVQAIERLQLQRGTALGSGLAIALATLLPDAGIDAGKIINGQSMRPAAKPLESRESGARALPSADAEKKSPAAAKPGSNDAAAIVLLTDGASNTGPEPLEVAKIAAEHGVRVYTVGVGTPEGAVLSTEGWSVRVRLDEKPLKELASATGGEYFRAGTATELKRVYQRLGSRMSFEKPRLSEVTAIFAAVGALLVTAGALLSLLWFNRVL